MAPPKRKAQISEIPVDSEGDVLKITPLGAGSEVGRSCIVLEYKGKTVMMDCGLHPAYSGLGALPFFDNIDPASVDILLITHFHLDHAAALPYFVEKTTFKGRIFMTHPTKAIFKWLLSDYVKVTNVSVADDLLYTEQDLLNCYERIEVVDYHQEIEIEGIKFTPYNAGHVLGAAMFLIEIAGVRVLYTGDYSTEEDRHLMAAERPKNIVPEVLITESTYGVGSHQPRLERETMFTNMIHKVVARGGRCLIPVFALGRAQELLLILDEYWQSHPELHNVPIYYASSLAKKCMAVYQTYSNMMNERIRRQIKVSNPFQFKHISNLRSVSHFDDVGPCVMMASPGMLQNGLSRELFELWCVDKRNGVLIPGYVVEGTLAKDILKQPDEITSLNGNKLPVRLSIEYISFSAHVDYQQNSQFIDEVGSKNLVLVHGEATEMGRLKSALYSKYAERDDPIKIFTPRNCETVELFFKGEKMAKTLGKLAQPNPPLPGQELSGVLVVKDFRYSLISSDELQEYTTDLVSTVVEQKQVVPCRAPFSVVRWMVESMYGTVKIIREDSIVIMDVIQLYADSQLDGHLVLEWQSSAMNDMIADSVLSIIIESESSPAAVKLTKNDHVCGAHKAKSEIKGENYLIQSELGESDEDDVAQFCMFVTEFLKGHFGDSITLIKPSENNTSKDSKKSDKKPSTKSKARGSKKASVAAEQDIKLCSMAGLEALQSKNPSFYHWVLRRDQEDLDEDSTEEVLAIISMDGYDKDKKFDIITDLDELKKKLSNYIERITKVIHPIL